MHADTTGTFAATRTGTTDAFFSDPPMGIGQAFRGLLFAVAFDLLLVGIGALLLICLR